jgi:CRP-like cAMP-binding protein
MPDVRPVGFSLLEVLRAHPCFGSLDDDSLARLAGQAVRRTYDPGQVILWEGEPSTGMWVVEAGHGKIYRVNPEGREIILHLFKSGDTFNDIAALDGGPNPANVEALSQVTAWVIASQSLYELMRGDVEVALAVLRALTVRVRELVQQIEDLALYSVTVRLARFLVGQQDIPPAEQPPITRATLAAHLATTPETISRALRGLEEMGAIQFDRHEILVVNVDLLQAIAEL